MSKGMTRAERLTELKRLYIQQAFSDIELAARLGVERTTIYKDRIALESEYPFVAETYARFRIDKHHTASSICQCPVDNQIGVICRATQQKNNDQQQQHDRSADRRDDQRLLLP